MTLINVSAGLPSYTWAVVRLLLTLGGKADIETAKSLLTPPTLAPGKIDEFGAAVKSLADLGIISEGSEIALTQAAQKLSPDDVATFQMLARRGALDPERNMGLEESPEDDPDLKGAKDFVRAIAWFLTQNPLAPHTWAAVEQFQRNAFGRGQAPPFKNDSRWDRFGYWAPALGLAARPFAPVEGRSPLLADCTVAVRDTVLGLWEVAETVPADEVVARIIEALPVLPGGGYSRRLGLVAPPDNRVSPALSYALLAGEEEGWLGLSNPSDASTIFLSDGSSTREVGSFTIRERA